MKNPKVTIYKVINGNMEYNYRNQIYMDALGDIMDIYYTRTIREEEGGTYGVGTMGQITNIPNDNYLFLIAFDTNKEMYEKLLTRLQTALTTLLKTVQHKKTSTRLSRTFTRNVLRISKKTDSGQAQSRPIKKMAST